MTRQEIESFLTVIQKGNLTEAAQTLCITQPTLTHRIQNLENELGAELIIRGKGIRSISLTEAGRGFVPIAERWERLWNETMRMVEQSQKQVLRVAATTTLGSYVMPEVYARFVRRGVPVILDINTLHSEGTYQALENRDLDIGFVARTMPSNRIMSVPVFSERMVLLCRAQAPWEGRIHPAELPAEKSVLLYWTHAYSLWHEKWFGAGRHAVDADNMLLAEKIVAGSDLWMIAPMTAAAEASKRGDLKIVELEDAPPDRVIYSLRDNSPDVYADAMTEVLRETVRDVPGVSIF